MGHETTSVRPGVDRRRATEPSTRGFEAARRSPSAVPRSSWPAPTANGPPRSPRGSAAPSAPSATPSTPSRRRGRAAWPRRSAGPKDARPILDEAKADPLKGILHQSPRRFGKARSTWTLDLLADVAFEQGLTPRRLSHEAVRQAVKRLGSGWKRAKQWITSPDPAYARKKVGDRLIRLAASHPDWVLGYQDETWWSRLALPAMHAWAGRGRAAAAGRAGGARRGTRTRRRCRATGCCGRTRVG